MPMSTRSAKGAAGGTSRCQVCNNPDTEMMVSCGQCKSLWHFQCVGVDDGIVDPERTFACPKCQQPLISTAAGKGTTNTGKSTSKHSSVSSERTSSSARARRAQLQLEKLEAQKALALKRLELESKKLELEAEVLEESFRLREEIERDEVSDTSSVSSQQSSRSKVKQWQQKQNEMLSSTIVTTAITVTEAELQEGIATTSRIGASQGGETQPAGNMLGRALAGISLESSASEGTLGGMIGRTSETVLQIGVSDNLGVSAVPPVTTASGVSGNYQCSLGLVHASPNNNRFPNESHIPVSLARCLPSQSQTGGVRSQISRVEVNPRSDQAFGVHGLVQRVPQESTVREHLWRIPRERPLMSRNQPSEDPAVQRMANPESPVQYPRRDFTSCVSAPAWGPSPQQIAARQVISKELPTFTGNPEDWPLFISSYTNTTQACGYSEAENLARLQRCLKGNAL